MVAVKDIGVRVETVGPDDGARFRIHAHSLEVFRVAQWLGHRAPEVLGEVRLSHRAIVENEA